MTAVTERDRCLGVSPAAPDIALGSVALAQEAVDDRFPGQCRRFVWLSRIGGAPPILVHHAAWMSFSSSWGNCEACVRAATEAWVFTSTDDN